MNKLRTIFRAEFITQLTPPKIMSMVITAILPLLVVTFTSSANQLGKDPETETWAQVGRLVSDAVMYTIIFRLISVLRDGTTLDKNRVAYLTHSKGKVLFSKIMADAIQFIGTIIFVVTVGLLIIVYKNHGVLVSAFYQQISVFIGSMFVFYILIVVGLRAIQYFIENKTIRNTALVIWFAITIVNYIVMAIVAGLVTKHVAGDPLLHYPVQEWVSDNVKWLMFVPFLNVMTISSALYGSVELWATLPLIGYTLLFTVAIWRKLSTKAKEFLCA